MDVEEALEKLRYRARIRPAEPLDVGYSHAELDRIESVYGFVFADDHRAFLRVVQPLGDGWWNWRQDSEESIRAILEWPTSGVLNHVKSDDFWPSSWGPRPNELDQRTEIATAHLATWPKLVPLLGHRYMQAGPAGPGTPVLSVHQTDVIYFGAHMVEYLHNELLDPHPYGQIDPVHARALGPWALLAEGVEDW